jgi:hypothetical protein
MASLIKRHTEQIAEKDCEIRKMGERWEAEVRELHTQVAKATKEKETVEAENYHLTKARQNRELAKKDPLESKLYGKDQEIWVLRQLNYDLVQHAKFFKEANPPRDSLQTTDLKNTMDSIKSELESILHGCDGSVSLKIENIENTGDLMSLMNSNFPTGSPSEGASQLANFASEFPPQLIIRTLALAALRDWVFYTDYPGFAAMEMSRPLLQAYRDIAMRFGES